MLKQDSFKILEKLICYYIAHELVLLETTYNPAKTLCIFIIVYSGFNQMGKVRGAVSLSPNFQSGQNQIQKKKNK